MTSAPVPLARPRLTRRTDLWRPVLWLDDLAPWRFAVFAVLVYVVLALFAYLPAWPGDPHRLVGCACGDSAQQAWYLGWAPWAILHGHNPFFTTWMEYPTGVNLAANTEMPLLGLVAAPVTFTAGSVASFSLLLWLAYPLSAASAFFVLRRWTHSNVGAFWGGLLYGFSAYLVAQGLGHLNLAFVPLPPLIFMALYEVFVRQCSRPHRLGVLLGLLMVGQYLISPEVLMTTALSALCCAVILGLARPRAINRVRLRYAWKAVWPAAVLSGVLLGYPVYFQLAGPLSIHSPVQPITNPYRADLLGPVVPTSAQRFAPGFATNLANRFTFGDVSETGSYLGIPLLLLTVWSVVRYRRDRWVLVCLGLTVSVYVLSLGPTLVVATHNTLVPLPFDVLGRLPLIDNILPARFALYQSFFVGAVVALATAHYTGRADPVSLQDSRRDSPKARRSPEHAILSQVAVLVLSITAVISLIPQWPRSTVDVAVAMPSFFTSARASRIPVGSVVLSYPFAFGTNDAAMLWQETDLWRWRLIGGYATTPNSTGGDTARPPALKPIAVQEFLIYWTNGTGGYLVNTPPPADARLVAQMRLYIRLHAVGTVVVDRAWPQSGIVLSVMQRALGPPIFEGGVDLWFHAQTRAVSP
ncbi:MAG: hypothetical protein ABSG36_08725 [Acidimicrobiales bacterium]